HSRSSTTEPGRSGGAAAATPLVSLSDDSYFDPARLYHRRRHRRLDGPGSRALCASKLLVAQPGKHPRKSQNLRTDSPRLPHGAARALKEQRTLQTPQYVLRRAADNDHRFCAAQPAIRIRPVRIALRIEPRYRDADQRPAMPHRLYRSLELSQLGSFLQDPLSLFRQYFHDAGSGGDGAPSGGVALQASLDAHRRRRYTGKVVLQVESRAPRIGANRTTSRPSA